VELIQESEFTVKKYSNQLSQRNKYLDNCFNNDRKNNNLYSVDTLANETTFKFLTSKAVTDTKNDRQLCNSYVSQIDDFRRLRWV
jgi:hypothetical protein